MNKILREHITRKNCNASLLQSGDMFFNRVIELIKGAQHYIHFQFYIIHHDITGQRILAALEEAVNRNVQVFIVVDAYASAGIRKQMQVLSKRKGFVIKEFSPLSISRLKFGRRMHHKIISIDGVVSIIGGINIADKYSGFDGSPAWLDYAVELSGSIVHDVEHICKSIWPRRILKRFQLGTLYDANSEHHGKMRIKLLQNDWLRRRIEISKAYKNMIRNADKEIILVVGYFYPGNSILRLIKRAKNRGVSIKLVMGAFSDVMIFKPATMYLYEWLLKNQIEIYEWKNSVLHAKIAMSDSYTVNVGSYNLNTLSDYGSLELNAEIRNEGFAIRVRENILGIIDNGCKRITLGDFHRKSNILLNAYRFICYQLIRFSLQLLFLLMQHRKVKF